MLYATKCQFIFLEKLIVDVTCHKRNVLVELTWQFCSVGTVRQPFAFIWASFSQGSSHVPVLASLGTFFGFVRVGNRVRRKPTSEASPGAWGVLPRKPGKSRLEKRSSVLLHFIGFPGLVCW